MLARHLILCAFVFGACCRYQRPTQAPGGSCLSTPPPVLVATIHLAGPEQGCPPEWAGCVSAEDGARLETHLRELSRYARDAWTLCGAFGAVVPSNSGASAPRSSGATAPSAGAPTPGKTTDDRSH